MKAFNLKILSIALVLGAGSAQAKVSDFNAMINENSAAQYELQKNVSQNIQELKLAHQAEEKSKIASALPSEEPTYISPTKKGFLKFKKEISNYKPSEQKQYERLAEELGEAY